jgi:hypothetical protein
MLKKLYALTGFLGCVGLVSAALRLSNSVGPTLTSDLVLP